MTMLLLLESLEFCYANNVFILVSNYYFPFIKSANLKHFLCIFFLLFFKSACRKTKERENFQGLKGIFLLILTLIF